MVPTAGLTYHPPVLFRVAGLFLVVLLLPACTAAAQELRVYLVTVGPGEKPWERYGHNALLFEDPQTGESLSYDWGRFDFDQPNFIARFVRGDMLYSSGVSDGNRVLGFYADQLDRRVELQELALSPEQTRRLLRLCEIANLPANSQYRYDYFIANCSTKLRDVLDEALGGQIAEQLQGVPAGTTFRDEAERHIAYHWPMWLGFNAGLGRPADRPIDAWEYTFLPAELRDWLRDVEIAADDGAPRPLVRTELLLNEGDAPVTPVDPPSRWWQTGILGLALAAGMLLLTRLRRPGWSLAAAGLWFLLAGLGGTLLLLLWAFTDHWAAYWNQSLLLLSPLGLPLAFETMTQRHPRAIRLLAGIHLGLCVLGALLHLVPGVGQENLPIIALALPANAAAAWVAGLRTGRRQSPTAGDVEMAPA